MPKNHSGAQHKHGREPDRKSTYKKNSLTLVGAVSMGTGVMIGAGIFALTGQIAELAGNLLPLAFLLAAVVIGFSAYSYVKMARAYPSAGGIAMFLEKAYGRSTMTGAGALLMAFSMVINESLVARTFGTYTLQLFDVGPPEILVPILGVMLIIFAFLINLSGNRVVGLFSFIMAFIKIGGIALFAIVALWLGGISFEAAAPIQAEATSPIRFLAGMALAILAYKGFTTITNSGSEIINPHRNVGRAIIISIVICIAIYGLVALAVVSNLSLSEIIAAKNFALAQVARPTLGIYGLWFTVGIAIIATASGLIASVFAVSRMLAMMTDMKLIPHRHFGMPGQIQKHTLVYTVVIAALLTIFFDLSRIASLGVVFYIVMDIALIWGVLRYLRHEVQANAIILSIAILFDVIVLGAFLIVKAQSDMFIVVISATMIALVFIAERFYLRKTQSL